MKIRPGTVTRREKAKNQFRLPTMSNTPAGLSSKRPAGGTGDELALAHAVQGRVAGPLAADDDAQDRARNHDRREHRDEHADDEDEGEAADDRRSEQVEDRGGDQARHVRVEDRVPGSAEARLDRRRQRLAEAQLLLRPLEDEDVRVDG